MRNERLSRHVMPPVIGRRVRQRMLIVVVLICGAFAFILSKAYQLQVTGHDKMVARANAQHTKSVTIAPPRGRILDRRGRVLAITGKGQSLVGRPKQVKNITRLAESLAAILGREPAAIEYRLAADRHFVWIARHVGDDIAAQVRMIEDPGIEVIHEPRRFYPYGALASHVVGFSNIDGKGLSGIERVRNSELSGEKRTVHALRDGRGRTLLPMFDESRGAGKDVTLTIDAVIQEIAERALARGVVGHEAKSGSVVVLDADNGAILAMASFPTFDPNKDRTDPVKTRNRVIADVFEMGSVMKPMIVAGALHRKLVKPGETFDARWGRYRYLGKDFHDSFRDRWLTVGGIIKRSSNIGMVQIAQRLEARGMASVLSDFGFGRPTGIGLVGETAGRTLPARRMSKMDVATASFGYGGTMATPLQVAVAMSAVVNGGYMRRPRLFVDRRPEATRVISEEVSQHMRTYLESVFEKGQQRGTASSVEVPGYRVGGKTGTARKVDPAIGKYSDEMHVASFAGAGPIEKPRLVVSVVVDEPHGEYYGGQVAAPIFAEIIGESLRYLEVDSREPVAPPAAAEKTGGSDSDDKDATPIEQGAFCAGIDFAGVPPGAAMRLASEHNLRLTMRGTGVVRHARTKEGACVLTLDPN